MRPKAEETLVSINCRIPESVYDDMQTLLGITQKTSAAFVKDAVKEYILLVKKNNQPSDSLQIDQFAWQLHEKK